MTSLLNGDVPKFTQLLGEYLMDALSFRDVVGDAKAENFYHGFVAALIASVRETHWVDSNKESGHGLYDVMLTPKAGQGTKGIILEFKHVKKSESLEEATEIALTQIDVSRYATVLARYPHITDVLKVGLAFSGKEAQSVYREENLTTHEQSNLYWTTRCEREEFEEETSGAKRTIDVSDIQHDQDVMQSKKKSKSSLQKHGLLGQQSLGSSSSANVHSSLGVRTRGQVIKNG